MNQFGTGNGLFQHKKVLYRDLYISHRPEEKRRFITEGTPEERINLLTEDKRTLVRGIIPEAQEKWISEMSNEEPYTTIRHLSSSRQEGCAPSLPANVFIEIYA